MLLSFQFFFDIDLSVFLQFSFLTFSLKINASWCLYFMQIRMVRFWSSLIVNFSYNFGVSIKWMSIKAKCTYTHLSMQIRWYCGINEFCHAYGITVLHVYTLYRICLKLYPGPGADLGGPWGPTPPPWAPILRPKFLPPPRLRCAMSAKFGLPPPHPPVTQILDPHLESPTCAKKVSSQNWWWVI